VMLEYKAKFPAPLIIDFTKKSSKMSVLNPRRLCASFRSDKYTLVEWHDRLWVVRAQLTNFLRDSRSMGQRVVTPAWLQNL
jgi:hypothetical protein